MRRNKTQMNNNNIKKIKGTIIITIISILDKKVTCTI